MLSQLSYAPRSDPELVHSSGPAQSGPRTTNPIPRCQNILRFHSIQNWCDLRSPRGFTPSKADTAPKHRSANTEPKSPMLVHIVRRQGPSNDEKTPFSVRCFLQILLRKEVIQPQVPLRLPCYDFIPIINHTFGTCLPRVGPATSGAVDFRDVTGGVYKARERIQGVVADTPLLAIPASWSRVADSNPNWGGFWRFAPPRDFASLCTLHCSTCAALAVRAILT